MLELPESAMPARNEYPFEMRPDKWAAYDRPLALLAYLVIRCRGPGVASHDACYLRSISQQTRQSYQGTGKTDKLVYV
jgi:hypothetical protein